ncbi:MULTISPECIES: TetR/AcrR family transcriptional regulator [unclassified Thioalkalivibrio]|uniref:TetR/AcrR family transcriptional regulator n=1 Tax=unclassified Thioalkalivibrio TaxID=2621013 RepID=UPI00036CD91C|nr:MULTISPECIES: TetR/AcrR family transcriptional regulator [unclassified Thioalkalivibrio]
MADAFTPTRTRDALIAAARSLILGRSYGAVGVAEICAHAGVKKGSLYHFFPGKDALVLEMLETLYRELEREVLRPSLECDLPLRDRLGRFVDRLYQFEIRAQGEVGELPGCPFGNLALELANWNSAVREAVAAHLEALRGHFQRAIETAVQSGELPQASDSARLSEQWLAQVEGVLLLAKARQDADTVLHLLPALETLLPARPADDEERGNH